MRLPLAGFALGWCYQHYAGDAAIGTPLVIAALRDPAIALPKRMAPLILIGTVWTHVFGGSAGREGTALQMGASLAEGLRQLLRLPPESRHWLVLAGVSGGFGSVFGTPFAGVIFALEVRRRMRLDGLLPCLAAAFVGDGVARLLGVPHAHYPQLPALPISLLLLTKVALAGVACGLVSLLFVWLLDSVKQHMRRIGRAPLRPLVGGALIVALMLAFGTRDYLGLSLPLVDAAVGGTGVPWFAFALKLLFTVLTLGSGFTGGEVTPLFVIGATLGHAMGTVLGVDPTWLASLGFVAVFAGASKTPLACAVMGVELFGGEPLAYLFVICAAAFIASGRHGIYDAEVQAAIS